MFKLRILQYFQGDRVVWIITLLLAVLSLLEVYSAAGQLAFRFKNGNTEYYLFQRIVILGVAIGIMYFAHRLRYNVFSKISVVALFASVPLLLLTLVMGASINQASRWLSIPGIPLTFQTSDFAKLALIIYVARMLGRKQDVIKDFYKGFLPIAIPTVVVCLLILPANFSTAAMLFVICIFLMFIGRVALKHIGALLGTAVLGLAFLILLGTAAPGLLPRMSTWSSRVEEFVNGKKPETTAELEQIDFAKMAMAEGQFFGTGPGNNLNKYRLPQGYSDFIFAMIVGEYGMIIGGIGTILCFLILLFRSIRIASKSGYPVATLMSIGLGLSLVFQAFINMAVAVNILPVTGQPLPMVSMGGTATIFAGLTLGIIVSVSRTIEKEANAIEESDR